jgi:hypothetical protein
MKSLEDRLNRLLKAAEDACPPVPELSPWFAQRMVKLLRQEETAATSTLLESGFLFRAFATAVFVMLLSVTLPLLKAQNPYGETLNLANSTIQFEKP